MSNFNVQSGDMSPPNLTVMSSLTATSWLTVLNSFFVNTMAIWQVLGILVGIAAGLTTIYMAYRKRNLPSKD